MKIALLADIHGNDRALAGVLAAARQARAERLLIAGDFVGYYYRPGAVLDQLSDWEWIAVRGNHEDMLRDWHEGRDRDAILARYGSGVRSAYEELAAESIDMLTALPHTHELTIGGRTVLMCHGTPWDPVAYVYPDAKSDVRARLAAGRQDLVLFGHSHYQVAWREASTLVVNPGSVGQPRDGMPGACWALWDTDRHEVSLRREAYDMAPLVAECRERDPHLGYLHEVLVRRRSAK